MSNNFERLPKDVENKLIEQGIIREADIPTSFIDHVDWDKAEKDFQKAKERLIRNGEWVVKD